MRVQNAVTVTVTELNPKRCRVGVNFRDLYTYRIGKASEELTYVFLDQGFQS